MSCDPNDPVISATNRGSHRNQGFGDVVHHPRVHTPMRYVAVFSDSSDRNTVYIYSIWYNQHVNAGLITRYRFFLDWRT